MTPSRKRTAASAKSRWLGRRCVMPAAHRSSRPPSEPTLYANVALRTISPTITIAVTDSAVATSPSSSSCQEASPIAMAIRTPRIGPAITMKLVRELVNSQLRANSSV
jgi:hypothetical protein